MHRLLKSHLKKVYGKSFSLENTSAEFQKLMELLSQTYDDFYVERQLLENVLEINSKELTEANKELAKNHELLRSVTESMDDAIFYKDLDFHYIGCNEHFARLTGLSQKEVVGKVDYELFCKEEADAYREADIRILEENAPIHIREWLTDANGQKHYFATVKSPLLNSKGEIIGLVGVARDVTEQHKMQSELESKKLMLIQQGRLASMGEMIGNIAHQWRQPLNALGLIVQKIGVYATKEHVDKTKVDENIEKGMELIQGMSNTIDDFRYFFDPNKHKELFSLAACIKKAYAIVEPSYINEMIELRMDVDEEISLFGYKNEFSQVIVNLLNNAKDVLVENRVDSAYVSVNIKKDNGNIVIEICDNGGGICPENLERVFEPYFSTKEEGKGTGIGLYMSKMIIEDHMKGKISVHNTDVGACFTLLFLPDETSAE